MTQELKTRASDEDDAWLEEALLLAASELSAFRVSAQTERERMQRAHEATRARVQALEEQLRQSEVRHAAELAKEHALLELQLGERTQAWAEFAKDVGQRVVALTAAERRHARDVEEAAVLRRELHEARAQLDAAHCRHAELEKRLAINEESFAVAADGLRKAREEAALAVDQTVQLRAEVAASAGLCGELQAERQGVERKLADHEAARAEHQARLDEARAELATARAQIATLEQEGRETQQLRLQLEQAREAHKNVSNDLARAREETVAWARALEAANQATEQAKAASKRALEGAEQAAERAKLAAALALEVANQATEQAKAAAATAEQRAEQAFGDVLAARRERDEVKQAQDTKLNGDLSAVQAERDQLKRELEEQATTRWAMLDMEKQRSTKLKTELDQSRAELEPLQQQRDRMASELAQLRLECDRLGAELSAAQSAQTAAIDVRTARFEGLASNSRDQATVPIPIPDRAPANQANAPAQRSREGTSYSYKEVAEEQVFVPARAPGKGGAGGRGSQ